MKKQFLANVGVQGTGAIVAAPDHNTPGGSYYYHWERDGALTMAAVQASKLVDASQVQKYADWVAARQATQDPHGIDVRTEPKYEIPSGAVYDGAWCRPQNDGPGLRALALLSFADDLWGSNQEPSHPARPPTHPPARPPTHLPALPPTDLPTRPPTQLALPPTSHLPLPPTSPSHPPRPPPDLPARPPTHPPARPPTHLPARPHSRNPGFPLAHNTLRFLLTDEPRLLPGSTRFSLFTCSCWLQAHVKANLWPTISNSLSYLTAGGWTSITCDLWEVRTPLPPPLHMCSPTSHNATRTYPPNPPTPPAHLRHLARSAISPGFATRVLTYHPVHRIMV